MKRKIVFVLISLLLALSSLGTASPAAAMPPAATTTITIKPSAMTSTSGSASGTVASLGTQDQSGTQNTPANYVAFTTPGAVYTGYRTYNLPAGVRLDRLTRFVIRLNYRGPLSSAQNWSWWLLDYAQGKYVKAGDNRKATSSANWTSFYFIVSNPARFISANRQIRLQIRSNNASGDARLDYEAIEVQYSTLSGLPLLNGCAVYPTNNIWNTPIDTAPTHARSTAWINSIAAAPASTWILDPGRGTAAPSAFHTTSCRAASLK